MVHILNVSDEEEYRTDEDGTHILHESPGRVFSDSFSLSLSTPVFPLAGGWSHVGASMSLSPVTLRSYLSLCLLVMVSGVREVDE